MKNDKISYKVILPSVLLFFILFMLIFVSSSVKAGSYNGEDLALAILANESNLISSSYTDNDLSGTRQSIILNSLGNVLPTNGDDFAFFSTGIAGSYPVTTNSENPGDERGTWFRNKHGHPRDEVTFTMILSVPDGMHYVYYDVQFFSTEYPEYVGTKYNDRLIITVDSPSEGESVYCFDVESGYFILDSNDLIGTGFDVFAGSGNPIDVDWIDTTPREGGADAGASDLVPIGGVTHPVSPFENVTITINLKDEGDNWFDSAAFIDNLIFSGYAKTSIVARKTAIDLDGDELECNDEIEYTITISNTGGADQHDNPGNEFEDYIPNNTTFVTDSAASTSGIIDYDPMENKIFWNGQIIAESSVSLSFKVKVDENLTNSSLISNQGIVYWDSNEDGTNNVFEYTDNPYIDDGIDLDGDGETGDDDANELYVLSFEPPLYVIEDFSNDIVGEKAEQVYLYKKWFETSEGKFGNVFEVVSAYKYLTDKSFKIQLRNLGGSQYWYYNLSNIESDIKYWEIIFKCGNASESSSLYLIFTNIYDEDIAKIRFMYRHDGKGIPQDWLVEMDYWSGTTNSWVHFQTLDYSFLYNGWYKLVIEQNDLTKINYSIYKMDYGLIEFKTDSRIGPSFSKLKCIEWYSEDNSKICPMFFIDEHKIGLIS